MACTDCRSALRHISEIEMPESIDTVMVRFDESVVLPITVTIPARIMADVSLPRQIEIDAQEFEFPTIAAHWMQQDAAYKDIIEINRYIDVVPQSVPDPSVADEAKIIDPSTAMDGRTTTRPQPGRKNHRR